MSQPESPASSAADRCVPVAHATPAHSRPERHGRIRRAARVRARRAAAGDGAVEVAEAGTGSASTGEATAAGEAGSGPAGAAASGSAAPSAAPGARGALRVDEGVRGALQRRVVGGGHHDARRQGQAGHARAGERDDAGAHGGRGGVVQVGGGLVQEDEPGAPVRAGGAQPRQRPGQGDAPQLAGAELHGPPVRRAVQGDGGEHGGALGVRERPAGRRVELLAHRGLEEARMLADPHGAFRVHAAHAPLHAGVRGAQQSREQVQEGGLAGAGGRAEHGERARRRAQVHALQDAPVPEGHADVLEDHRAARGRRGVGRARRCGGGVRERVPGRLGHGRPRGGAGPALGLAAVLGGVVRAADVTQGQVHLGGQDEDHEPGTEVHLPVDEAQADEHGHHGHGERGDQLEGHAGDERGAQGAQGGGVVPLRGPLEGAALDAGPAQPHEHGQSAGELHEVAGEAVQPVLGGVDPLLGVPADEDHEEGHERDGQQHHEGGERVPGEDPGAEDRGHDGGGGQGRQDLGVVVVQALQAVGDQHGVRARAGA